MKFGEFLRPNARPYTLGPQEDANLVGMRLYGGGPFHRELKPATRIAKKTHFVIRAGDVIYNKLFAWKGTFGIVPNALDGMFVSDKFPTYELDRQKVDERFLSWYFRCPPLWEEARVMSTGSAALSKLTLNPPKFLLLTMPMPELGEQRQVVSRVEELATRIGEASTLRRQAAMEAASLLRSCLHNISTSLEPAGRLGDVLSSPPRNGWSVKCDSTGEGTAVLSLGAVTGFRYRSTEFKRTSLEVPQKGHFWLRPGDVLMTRSNSEDLVGHVAIYDGNPTPCIYPDLMMRLDINSGVAETQFVWYWLQAPLVREFIKRSAKGTNPTMKKISHETVIRVPFPSSLPVHKQRRIVAELDLLHSQVDALKRLQGETASGLGSLLPAILDRAFKGQLA